MILVLGRLKREYNQKGRVVAAIIYGKEREWGYPCVQTFAPNHHFNPEREIHPSTDYL